MEGSISLLSLVPVRFLIVVVVVLLLEVVLWLVLVLVLVVVLVEVVVVVVVLCLAAVGMGGGLAFSLDEGSWLPPPLCQWRRWLERNGFPPDKLVAAAANAWRCL